MSTNPYARATESIRSTAKWLVTALTGAGLLSLAGFQASRLGELSSDTDLARLMLAVGVLGLSAALVGLLIWKASAIFTERWITLAQISDEYFEELLAGGSGSGSAILSADDIKDELHGSAANSIAELHKRLRETNALARQEIAQATDGAVDEVKDTYPVAQARAADVGAAAEQVVDYANFLQTKSRFESLAPLLAAGVSALVLLNVTFVLLTSPPESESLPQDLRVELID